jgi:hypothetical protein
MSVQADSRNQDQPAHTRQPHVSAMDSRDALFVGPAVTDEIDGLQLSDAASTLGISVDEIWRRIRNGMLLARTEKGKVLVYTDLALSGRDDSLPPPPGMTSPDFDYGAARAVAYDAPRAELTVPGHSQEIALLIDHLSLAKEENREILRLTQDSMARLSQMTDAMMDMKDSIIASKEEQMSILKERLAEEQANLLRALKEKEDLETLTQALQQR